ncbi:MULTISPECIES: DNA primase [Cryobacterium]|uniref:DNA primase n=1 Tax=Cryobacterium breve TaxID=1259258 RepID=A0ABY2IYC6_9MICO|nr:MULTISPECIES: DNA primase [Cryobacterium]TFC96718.1 DNA primase [Cryobacterium sp. TmT3-12]TFC97485.1 DNA primase [Cryobacterium breve]
MAGLIRQNDIEEVKARTNIADIVGDYVSLKSAGVGSMKGLCPFHDERSPSFHVRPQVGFYHCFGCGESGDVYSFLQKMDHVSFSEAVERLAGRVGIELHYEGGAGEAPDHTNRARLYAANQAASDFFVERLGSAGALVGRAFLGERGFDSLAAARFGVGFAPKSWDELTNHLRGKGFSTEELTLSGLVTSGDRGVYDRFRGRLVWPIRDITGQTIGFGARRLLDDDKGPKYLNTPETPIYHKSQVLYGLDLAKRDISRGHQVVVVEGYTDVMACHLAGVTTAVATCGTSFGVDHIKVLRRVLGDDSGVGEVVFTFDPDAAGQKAAMRAFSEEQRFSAQTYVAVAPEGLDPCDLRLHRGDDAVRRLIDSKKPMFEFMIRQLLGQYNLDTVEGRVAALRAAAPIVGDIRDPALRPGYTHELARMLGMELGEVGRAVSAAVSRSRSSATTTVNGPPRADEPAPREQPFSMLDLATDPVTRMERDGLMAMLQRPTLVGAPLIQRAVQTHFSNSTLALVRDAIAATVPHHDAADWLDRIVAEVPPPVENLVKELAMASLPERSEREVARYVRDITVALIHSDLLRQKAELLGRLQRADATNREVYVALQRELVRVEAERRNLRED